MKTTIAGQLWSYDDIMPKLGERVFVAPGAQIIGDVVIGDDSSVWYNCVIRGDVNNVIIGKRTNIQDGAVIHVSSVSQGTYIGDDITVGHMALLHACTVESGAFIGMKACVMDDAFVESGAMVAAGALIAPGKRVKSRELWAGVPARPIRGLSEEEQKYLLHSPKHYVGLASKYLHK